jgi:hypothetical protein
MKPLSSRKTMLLPARRAFFYMHPLLLSPTLDLSLVSLPSTALRFLAAPPLSAQDLPDMGGVVVDPIGPSDDFGDSWQRPEIRRIPLGGGPLEKQFHEACSLLGAQPTWPSRRRFRP